MPHHSPSHARNHQLQMIAKGLGWFSIALGAMEVLAPRRVSRELGAPRRSRLVSSYGAREIATGVGILASRNPAPWLWGRVAGDALDIASLLPVATTPHRKQGNAIASLAAVAGVLLLDAYCARQLSGASTARAGQGSSARSRKEPAPKRDYSGRSGFPRSPQEMRGAARETFKTPQGLRNEVWRAAE